MKIFVTIVLLAIKMQLSAQELEVKTTIDAFFSAMHTRDTVKLKEVCLSQMALHSVAITSKGERFTAEDSKEFIKSIAAIPPTVKIEEKLLSYDIKINGPIAHAWTPYEFYIDGKLSHGGVNSFQLVFLEGRWKIAYIIDTRKRKI